MAITQEVLDLRMQLDELGIDYAPALGEKKLKELLDENTKPEVKEPKELTKMDMIKEATQLIRVIISPMSPEEHKLSGNFFRVGNSIIPSEMYYVPYNIANGWHVPKILLDTLKEKTYVTKLMVKNPKTNEEVLKTAQVPSYNIIELPPITDEELEDLKKTQLLRNSSE